MYSKIFPLLSKGIYLNTAYVGLMSKGLVEFRANNEKDYLQKGEDYKKNSYKTLEETHRTVSRFFSVNLNNAFVVNNFSSGIRHVIRFLPKKLKVLLIDKGSVLASWVHSSVVRAADCRSAGPWFKSGCALT